MTIVGVMGSGTSDGGKRAAGLGRLLASLGVHLLTGGGGGTMAAVGRAFVETPGRRGLSIGVLPCADGDPGFRPKAGYPNRWVEIPIATHLPLSGIDGESLRSRNPINILSSDAVVALAGGAGTRSEVRLALRCAKPVLAYVGGRDEIPDLPGEIEAVDSLDAVRAFLETKLRLPA